MGLDIIARGLAAQAQSYAAIAEQAKEAAEAAAKAAEEAARTLTIDDTLTEQGEAADAKAAGDAAFGAQSMIAQREASSTATQNYSIGDLVIVDNVLYRVTSAIASGETITAGVNVTTDTVEEELVNRAKTAGTYPDFTAGLAGNLISNIKAVDQAPYTFRTAGGSLEIGSTAQMKQIVGATAVWNQGRAPSASGTTETVNGVTFTVNTDGSVTASGTAGTGGATHNCGIIRISKDHVVAVFGCPPGGGAETYFFAGTDYGYGRIYPKTQSEAGQGYNLNIKIQEGATVNGVTFRPQSHDLTDMFGPAIADHVYALEQSQAGAGCAWFRSLFSASFYAYDPGTPRSVNVSRKINVGFNALNPATGTARLLGGRAYQITGTYTDISYADEGGGTETITPDADGKFTPERTGTLTVTGGGSGTCIHLVWDGERDGETEAYDAHTYPLDGSVTLQGVYRLDGDGNLVADGDTYAPDGNVTRNYVAVDLGSLTWTTNVGVSTKQWIAPISVAAQNLTISKGITNSGFEYNYSGGYLRQKDACIVAGGGNVFLYNTAWDGYTGAQVKAALAGKTLIYAIAEPTAEAAEPYTKNQIESNWGTEQLVDAGVEAGTRDVAIPAGHTTYYPIDIKAMVEAMPESPGADGDYIMRRTGGENAYVPLTRELPTTPAEDGTYVLKCTVSSGMVILSWVTE